MSEQSAASKWVFGVWFWGTILALTFLDPDSPTSLFRNVVITLAAIPALAATATSFTHPKWFARQKHSLLHAVLWIGGALAYWILTTTGRWVDSLDHYAREGRPEDQHMVDFIISRVTQNWDRFHSGFVVVVLAALYLIVLMLLRGTPLSEIGGEAPPETSSTDAEGKASPAE